jgi:hypothetical protein
MSCIWIDLEKQIVLRTNRLIRVRCTRPKLPRPLTHNYLLHKKIESRPFFSVGM